MIMAYLGNRLYMKKLGRSAMKAISMGNTHFWSTSATNFQSLAKSHNRLVRCLFQSRGARFYKYFLSLFRISFINALKESFSFNRTELSR